MEIFLAVMVGALFSVLILDCSRKRKDYLAAEKVRES
jgi:hypothetical protein